jgi:hydroxymethylglutaryl-CoA lyase
LIREDFFKVNGGLAVIRKRVDDVTITDVTLREYGQNVPAAYLHVFTPAIRSKIASGLIEAGFTNIEILSCVHPKVAPAMDTRALRSVAGALGRVEGVNFITLVPNRTGYERFLDVNLGPDGFSHTMGVFFSAVEAHHIANIGKTLKETIEAYKPIIKDAISRNIRVVGYISAAFGYIGSEKEELIKPNPQTLNEYMNLYFDLGVETVTLSDLQGVADETETSRIIEGILDSRKGKNLEKLGYHPHHVDGEKAIANSKVVYDLGVRRFDSSMGGTGGCVTGAPGNQPTERLVHFFNQLGIENGINETQLFSLSEMVQKELYSKIALPR